MKDSTLRRPIEVEPARTADGAIRGARVTGVAAVLVMVYLVASVLGWATNGTDGYYGVAGVETSASEANRLIILDVVPGSPADRAGVRPGDRIVAMDGQKVTPGSRARWAGTSATPTFQTRPLALQPGDAPLFRRTTGNRATGELRTLTIERPDAANNESAGRVTQEITLVLDSQLAAPGVVLGLLVRDIVGLLTLAVGVFVLLRRPSDVAARLLLSMTGCFAIALALLSCSNRPLPTGVALALQIATAVLLVVGSASLLHLCLAFPSPHGILVRLRSFGPGVLKWLGGGVVALYVLPVAAGLGLYLGPASIWPWSYVVVMTLIGMALVALGWSMCRPPTPTARAQLKWVAGPLAVGLLALAVGPGVRAVSGAGSDVNSTIVVAAWVLFPLGVGFAILRYRLFDVDLVFRAAMLYPLLAALLAGAYLAIAQLLSTIVVSFIGPSAEENLIVAALAALFVASVAHPLYRRLQLGLDRLLFRDRLARQRLLDKAMKLNAQTTIQDVEDFLIGEVVRELKLSPAWLVLLHAVRSSDGTTSATLRTAGEALLSVMRDVGKPVFLLKKEELSMGGLPSLDFDDPAVETWHSAGARLLIPLLSAASSSDTTGNELLGVWVVGTHRSGSLLDSEDVQALTYIAQQASILMDNDRLLWRQAAEIQRNARFRRYFSPQIADVIAEERAELASHRREITVLFAELRGFAALGEALQPEELVAHLNKYLVAMTDVIFRHGGTLDKYLSDGVLAFFGDPLPQADHAARATDAARGIQQRFEDLSGGLPVGVARVDVSIGLATGWVTVGTIGSVAREEYTVVGDAVAVASRLASTAQSGGVQMAETTRRMLGEQIVVVPNGEVAIEGRRQPVRVFALPGGTAGVSSSSHSALPMQTKLRADDYGDGGQEGFEALADAMLLARSSFFAALPKEELQALARRLRVRRYKKGAVILQPHEKSPCLFLIKSGTVKVTRGLVTGDEAVINILGRGEFFGEHALLEGESDNSTVVALQAAEILLLSRDVFDDCLRSYPSTARATVSLLTERIRRLSDQLEEAYAMELPQRLARRLIALGTTVGKKTDDGLVIDLQLTQSELAGMVGASRQRVNRVLADWQDRRLLRLGSYGRMTLLRPDSLTDLSSDPLEG